MRVLPLWSTGAQFLWDTVRYCVNCISELFRWKGHILGYFSTNFHCSVVEGYFGYPVSSRFISLGWACSHSQRMHSDRKSASCRGTACRSSLEGKGSETGVQMAFARELCGIFFFPIVNIVRHKILQSWYSYYLSVRNFTYAFMYLSIYLCIYVSIYLSLSIRKYLFNILVP